MDFIDKWFPPFALAVVLVFVLLLLTGCSERAAEVEIGEVVAISSEDHRVYGFIRRNGWEEY